MFEYNNSDNFNFSTSMPEPLRERSFRDINESISGRSVVIEKENKYPAKSQETDMWPYSLSDYLKRYIGKTVLLKYALPNNRCYENKGELKVVGTNFIGVYSYQTYSLLLVELSSIISVSIV